jgi:hypothetical protein
MNQAYSDFLPRGAPMATCAVFFKECRERFADPTRLDRKSAESRRPRTCCTGRDRQKNRNPQDARREVALICFSRQH